MHQPKSIISHTLNSATEMFWMAIAVGILEISSRLTGSRNDSKEWPSDA